MWKKIVDAIQKKVNENHQTITEIKDKLQTHEGVLGTLTGDVRNYPTIQAQTTQTVGDLTKATAEYAKELRVLKEVVNEYVSKSRKNTEAANELSRKLEESDQLLSKKIDNFLSETKSLSSVVSGYSSKIEKIDKIDTKIDKIVQTTEKITASVKENNPTVKMDSIIKSLNTIQDNQKKNFIKSRQNVKTSKSGDP